MNTIKMLIVAIGFLTIISCKEASAGNDDVKAEKTEISTSPNIKKVALNIEGMTCEIGCARTIESKLAKKEGVTSAEVDFDKKEGVVSYDANKISEKQIVATVEEIAGGDTYKVTDVHEAE